MNWMIIVGIIFIIGGIGNIVLDIGTFFFGIIVGGVLLFFGLRKKGYFKNIHLKNLFRKQTGSPVKQPRTSGNNHPQPQVNGCVLAYSYDDVKFYPPVELVQKISQKILYPGAEVFLKSEPNNKYDDRAVALYVSGHQIGYLLRGTLQDMANDYIARGWPIKSTLVSLKKSDGEYHGYITLAFYRPEK